MTQNQNQNRNRIAPAWARREARDRRRSEIAEWAGLFLMATLFAWSLYAIWSLPS